jgi:hypothetical protein
MNPAAAPDTVNAHYLGHVVGTGETHQVEASEDIVAGNGTKLLAKGVPRGSTPRERAAASAAASACGVPAPRWKPSATG